NMLFWSFCLLTFVQCVAGLILSTLCREFLTDPSYEMEEQVFRYYGTFTRCILGFAVLNVVNAVFVQQTMKTASSDEELAFKQKERDAAMYLKKVKKLFQSIDQSGDGAISLEELEYHDLLSLFEFLDNGNGEITLMEFVEGASRLRGRAKTLDIWRLETKLEVLFEEVFNALRPSHPAINASVQEVFNQSQFRHMKATSNKAASEHGSPRSPSSPNLSIID
ncbi:unnamed protein product, partial [Effrenium voratum]